MVVFPMQMPIPINFDYLKNGNIETMPRIVIGFCVLNASLKCECECGGENRKRKKKQTEPQPQKSFVPFQKFCAHSYQIVLTECNAAPDVHFLFFLSISIVVIASCSSISND